MSTRTMTQFMKTINESIPARWTLSNVNSDRIKAVYLQERKEDDPKDPIVTKSIALKSDMTWSVRVLDKVITEFDIQGIRNFKNCQNIKTPENFLQLLHLVDDANICCGNPDIEINQDGVTSQSIIKETNVDIEMEDGSVFNATIRSSQCTMLVKTGSIRCKECQKQRGYLRVLKSRQAKGKQCTSKRTAVDSHVNYRFLSSTEKDEKIRNLHKQPNATKRTLKCVQSKLAEAIRNEGHVVDGEINEFLKGMLIEGENLKDDLPEGTFRRLFWEQQLRAIRCTDARQIRWHPLMIKWCLNIKLRSSSAYTAMRNPGFIKLPSERTLRDYTHWTKISSGFQPSSFERLLFEANYKELEDWQKFIILLHDEVKIQSDIVYSKHTGELIGFVNVGDINNALVEKQCKEEIVNTTPDIASCMLVFMVRGAGTRLEYPLAHFPCNGSTADLLYPLL